MYGGLFCQGGLARLDAIEKRLERRYKPSKLCDPRSRICTNSLNDDQRQRLDALGAKETEYGRGTAGTSSSDATTLASLCGDQAANFTRLPVQRIEEIIKPTGQQQNAFDKLRQVSENRIPWSVCRAHSHRAGLICLAAQSVFVLTPPRTPRRRAAPSARHNAARSASCRSAGRRRCRKARSSRDARSRQRARYCPPC